MECLLMVPWGGTVSVNEVTHGLRPEALQTLRTALDPNCCI